MTLKASGSMGLAAQAPLQMSLSIAADLAQIPAPKSWRLAGSVNAEVKATGDARGPRMDGSIVAERLSLSSMDGAEGALVSVPEAKVQLEGDRATLSEIRATVGGGALTLSGGVGLATLVEAARGRATRPAQGHEAQIRASWEGVQAGPLLASLGCTQKVRASLSGNLEVRGGLGSLQEMSGALRVPATDVGVEDLELQIAPVAIALDQGSITMDRVTLSSALGRLDVQGRLDLVRRSLE
ncbi:MAG TPA: hypothetical protein VN083_07505, partial [Vicinamibacteria bacterium]|nr:hypothetical protein [Vicinamibacteria bacterium]